MIVVTSLREKIASVQHAIWAHWMKHMFTQGNYNADGSWTMPADKVERWSRQMNTDYSDLTDKERERDRDQADKVLPGLAPLSLTDVELEEWVNGLPQVPLDQWEGLDSIIDRAMDNVFGPQNLEEGPE